jgi:hypothetical protein
MTLAYIASVIGGLAAGLTVALDRTLSSLNKAVPSRFPSLAPGGWLRRRYIESMAAGVALWIASGAYLFFGQSALVPYAIMVIAAIVGFLIFTASEGSIRRRLGQKSAAS